jgi:hypothetical protein
MARSPLDYYPTPTWATRRFLEAIDLPGGKWLEPCAGDGAIVRVVDRSDVEWVTVDLTPYPGVHHVENYLERDPGFEEYDVCLSNFPFTFAFEFLRKAMEECDITISFLRLAFLESTRRNAWLRRHTPNVYILPNRPYPKQAWAYGWLVWGMEPIPPVILANTSAEERGRG